MCVSGDGSDELTLRENGGGEKWSFTSLSAKDLDAI